MTLILLGILVVGLIIALIYWLASSWGAGPRLPDPSSPQYQTPVQPSGDMAADVRAMLVRKQKIGAVKMVRERTGWGLKEAKDYVDAHERGRPLVDLGSAPTAAPDGDLADDVRDLVSQGQTIHAVKLVRERTGWGLKEAKDYVDAIRAERGL